MEEMKKLPASLAALPYNIQKEIIRRLKLKSIIALQKTSKFGRDIVELVNSPLFRLFKEIDQNRLSQRKNSSKHWRGDPAEISVEIGVLLHMRPLIESGLTHVGDQCVRERAERLEKVVKVWTELFGNI